MLVRPPAPCRRTVPPQATTLASHSGIWITDAILRRGLERFHERLHERRHGRRFLSSHSGPLESRRRLGKRNMAGLMPSTPIHAPLWHFEVLSIPNTWQWEPPSTKEERSKRGRSLSLKGLLNRFMSWLESTDAAKPFIQPPPLDAIGEAVASSARTEDGIAPKVYEHPIDYPKEILSLRQNIALVEEMDGDLLHRLCKTCRRSLQRRLERRHLSVEGLYLALEPFDERTMGLLPDHQLAAKFATMIRRTVLASMEDVQKEDPHAPFQHLWLSFAAWICASNGGHSKMQLFWRLMHAMPESLRAEIPSDQLLQLTHTFISGQADRHNVFKHWIARTKNFAESYGTFSVSQREKLRADIDSFLVKEEEKLSERNKRIRFSWLAVQAYDKTTSNEEFISSYHQLISSQGFRLTNLQLWQLMLGRAKSMGLEKEAISQVMETGDSSTSSTPHRHAASQRWSALVHAISNSTSINGSSLKTMCECLKSIGEMETMVDALLSARAQSIRVDCLQALAAACDDYRFALQLHEALKAKSINPFILRKHFSWEFWVPFVRDMIKDETLQPATIGRLLHLSKPHHHHHLQGANANADSLVKEVTAKVELLDKMGHWYIETTHLSDRQLLRRISECAALQRTLINSVTDITLANLTHVIARDLERGKWGRTTRLEWLLRLVAELRGKKEAASAASVVRGWRFMINQSNGRS